MGIYQVARSLLFILHKFYNGLQRERKWWKKKRNLKISANKRATPTTDAAGPAPFASLTTSAESTGTVW